MNQSKQSLRRIPLSNWEHAPSSPPLTSTQRAKEKLDDSPGQKFYSAFRLELLVPCRSVHMKAVDYSPIYCMYEFLNICTSTVKNERTNGPISFQKQNQNVLVSFPNLSCLEQIVSIWSRICSSGQSSNKLFRCMGQGYSCWCHPPGQKLPPKDEY
jgi:hypothetical protein